MPIRRFAAATLALLVVGSLLLARTNNQVRSAAAMTTACQAFLKTLDARLFEIADVDDDLGSLALGFSGFHAVVVRPDRYVFGVAAEPAALDPLVRELKRLLG